MSNSYKKWEYSYSVMLLGPPILMSIRRKAMDIISNPCTDLRGNMVLYTLLNEFSDKQLVHKIY